MLTTIQKATENFCDHQIREEYKINNGITDKKVFIAYIDIDTETGSKHRVYIASNKALIQKIIYLFLEEDKSDEETLISMLLETTNLVIGSAKVIAEESQAESFTIGTPFFEKIDTFSFEVDSAKTFVIGDDTLTIAIKRLYDR